MRILFALIVMGLMGCSQREDFFALDGVWVYVESVPSTDSGKAAKMIEPFPANLLEFGEGYLREAGVGYSEENKFTVNHVDGVAVEISVHYEELDEVVDYQIIMEGDSFLISSPRFKSPSIRFKRRY